MLTRSELATLERAESILIRRCMLGHRDCAAEASRELYADLPAWSRASRIIESLPSWSETLAKRDWRYQARTAKTLNVYYSDLLHRRYRKEIETGHRLRLAALPRARAIVGAGR